MLTACGGGSAASSVSTPLGSAGASGGSVGAGTARVPGGDWTRFNYDAQRSGVGPTSTGITTANVGTLSRRRVNLGGVVDSSPIELHAVKVRGRARDVVFVTTTYGRTIAIDPGTGAKLWQFVPADIRSYEGSFQFTNSTPVSDPNRRYVYATDPAGRIHKLAVSTGHEVRSGHWPVRVTFDARHEKLAAALNISGNAVIATTGGYIGDAPPYVGHVVTIDRGSGRIMRVWNSLCSERHDLIHASSCAQSDSAIWAREGAVVEPDTHRILVATGNAAFNGSSYWGDSVLELTADAGQLLQNWTPANQRQLGASDTDVGSTAPAILPPVSGFRLVAQSGKDGHLYLLNLGRLNGTGQAGPRLGGELQRLDVPGTAPVFTAPAVWTHNGRTYVFLADSSGTAVYLLHGGARPRLSVFAQNGTPGTSPIVAGGLLYVYDQNGGAVKVYQPPRLRQVASLPAAGGHWNSPIALGGRVILPEGNANDQSTNGTLDIYHLPGR